MVFPQSRDNVREVVAEDKLRAGDPNFRDTPFSNAVRHAVDRVEEGLRELIELDAFGGETERLPIKKLCAQVLLKSDNLAAQRRLLDAIGHVLDRFADPAVASHIVEELEVMEVHAVGSIDYATS